MQSFTKFRMEYHLLCMFVLLMKTTTKPIDRSSQEYIPSEKDGIQKQYDDFTVSSSCTHPEYLCDSRNDIIHKVTFRTMQSIAGGRLHIFFNALGSLPDVDLEMRNSSPRVMKFIILSQR